MFFPIKRAQREAIKRLVERNNVPSRYPQKTVTYRELRKAVQPCFDKSGCIMLPLWGMWLGIEVDGYTHS